MKWTTVLLLTLVHLAGPVRAADDARPRWAELRAAVEQRFAAEQRDCAQRFAVTACVEDARLRRRDALTMLAKEQAAVETRERRAASEQRRLANEKARSAVPAPGGAAAASAPAAARPAASAAAGTVRKRPPARAGSAVRLGDEHRALAAYERRRSEAEAHRRTVEARNAARQARGTPRAAALPQPASAPAK